MELTVADLTLVLVPDGDLGRDIQDMAASWSRAGLLRPSVWLAPSNVERSDGGPPRVRASLISGPTAEAADLFTIVGLQRLERVRLVVVHPSGIPDEAHSVLSGTAVELSRLLTAALPLGTSDEERGTVLHRMKLLVPTSGSRDLPPASLQSDWDVNAVVSPEDRPDVDRGSIFVRADGNYVGHIVNAICAAGGLWEGMPSGALDAVTTDSTTSDGWLHVLRPTVRAVLGSHRTEQLVEQAVSAVAEADPSDFVAWGRRASLPGTLAARAAERLVTSPHWVPPEPTTFRQGDRDVRSAGEVLGSALRYNVRLFATGWRWLVRSGEASLERTLTGHLVGQESDIQVAIRPHSPASLAALGRTSTRAAEQTLGEALSQEGLGLDAPAPETWRDLRLMTLGLVDGGRLPEGIRAGGSGSLVEVIPRSYAVPQPNDTLKLGTTTIGIVDAVGFQEIAKRIERRDSSEEAPELRASTAQESEPRTNEEEERQAHEDGTSADSEEGGQADGFRAGEWLNRRKDSFLWLVAVALADRLATARARRAQLESMAQVSTDTAFDGLAAAYRRLVRSWRMGVLGLLVGLGVLLWQWLVDDAEVDSLLIWAAVGLFVWVLLIGWANHRYFKADLKYRRDILLAIAERRSSAEELVSLRRSISWLQVRYDGLMLWAAILAEIVHRPWGKIPQVASSMSADEVERLPAAVALAMRAGSDREEFGARVITDAVNALCPMSYASRHWEDTFEAFLRHSGRGDHVGIEVVDNDELQTRASPRRELLQFMTEGPARDEGAQRAVDRLADAVARDDVRLPPLRVRRLGPYSDGKTITEDEFYAASLRAATPFTIDFWTPEGQLASKHLPNRALVWVPRTPDGSAPPPIELRRSNGRTALRVDLSRRCSVEDVVAFQPSAPTLEARSWSTAELDEFN